MTRAWRTFLCSLWWLLAAGFTAEAAEYGATYSLPVIAPVNAGQLFTVTVTVTNAGTRTWTRDPCLSKTAFRLAYHWAGGPGAFYEGERKPVNKTVKPGDKDTFVLAVQVPAVAGNYTLQLDMVEEGVTWFSTSADKVKTGDVAVVVNPAPVQPKVTGLAFDYTPVSKGDPVKVFVKRDGTCAYQLDFGDGQTATGGATTAGSGHVYTQEKTFSVTAKGTGGCTGQATAQITAYTPFFICWYCASYNCGDLLIAPPKIQALSTASLEPGTTFNIQGSGFGAQPGQVTVALTDFKGAERVIPLEIVGGWSEKLLTVRVPADLSELKDQLALVTVLRGNVKSNTAFAVFHPAQEIVNVPRSLVTVGSCGQGVACNSCNDKKSGGCFMFDSAASINGFHLSEAFLCLSGGGSGVDSYSLSLKNGWRLANAVSGQMQGNVTLSGFAKDSTSIQGGVSWKVGTCGQALYQITLQIIGPRGVPFV